MTSKYVLERTDFDDTWNSFVDASPEGTLFSRREYVASVKANTAAYYLLKSREIKAAVAVVESDDAQNAILHDLVIYNGIMFSPPQNKQNRATILSEHFRIATELINELGTRYRRISLALSPSIIDVRPFLWYNYGTDKPKYSCDIRYTSYVNIADFRGAKQLEDIPLFHETSYSRRQELRYALREGVCTREEFDPHLFVDFYRKTMGRQDLVVQDAFADEMETLLAGLFKRKLGRMFVSYTSAGEPGSMSFFGVDRKRAYYLFGASDPALRDTHTGSAVLWDSFTVLSGDGIQEIDLEGVNSPARGWFKLSFGGNLLSYYHVFLK